MNAMSDFVTMEKNRAMRDRKKPDVEKALSMFKNPQQAAHLAWLLENKKNNRS